MYVKVVKKFRDKYTKKIHLPGERLNVTKERMNEILSVGEFVKADSKKKETEERTSE